MGESRNSSTEGDLAQETRVGEARIPPTGLKSPQESSRACDSQQQEVRKLSPAEIVEGKETTS